jgi:hypothetical protein
MRPKLDGRICTERINAAENAPDRPENLNFLLENNTGTSFRSHAWFPALPK